MVAAVNNPDPPGRIVVVDDDPTVADVVGRYLVRDGHHVECVRDGQEALRRVAEEPPDLVVLDLMLPGIDGLEVCRRLRARWPIPGVELIAPVATAGKMTHVLLIAPGPHRPALVSNDLNFLRAVAVPGGHADRARRRDGPPRRFRDRRR